MSRETNAHAIKNGCTTECRPMCNIAHKRIALEKKVLRKYLSLLRAGGWIVVNVHDGERSIRALTVKDALDTIFSVDESTVIVANGTERSWFMVVLGNGIDCVPDYGSKLPDEIMERAYDIASEWE